MAAISSRSHHEANMKERITGTVEIDYECSVVFKFFKFIYSDFHQEEAATNKKELTVLM